MGWFWSSGSPITTTHPPLNFGREPPPSCPMHISNSASSSAHPHPTSGSASLQSCPVNAPSRTGSAGPSRHTSNNTTLSKLNPLNYMPNLSQDRAPNQKFSLPTTREESTIPRGDMDSNWEYPSPQQMYNALLRKGYDDTPADAVESMVAVHNFLNEGAWRQILGWERRFSGGLVEGFNNCSEGEERFDEKIAKRDILFGPPDPLIRPKLSRFMGRPNDKTPKVRMLEALGWLYPKTFGTELPFDRHDWYVQRTLPDGSSKEVRYVIDYYSGPPEPTGEPVFYLDVRPAIDTPTAAAERLLRWGGDVWYRASGGETRSQQN